MVDGDLDGNRRRAHDIMVGYEIYGKLAESLRSPVVLSGRYSFQAADISELVADVQRKLAPQSSHRLLEVGCNVGILLTPLAMQVAEAVGIDHPRVLDQYRAMTVPANVTLLAGQWPSVRPEGDFDRILVYSVIHYLLSAAIAREFIDACLERLRPGGRLLIGDIPNRDAKARFTDSAAGREFSAHWNARKADISDQDVIAKDSFSVMDSPSSDFLDDDFVFRLLHDARRNGVESFLLPQSSHLPFGNTREDILFIKR